MSDIIKLLNSLYEERGSEVKNWLANVRANASPFFYTSVDLRHSGIRIAPVDTNIFPAGFNNLSPAARNRASISIKRFFQEKYPYVKKVLIIPENHTRNLAYFDNLATILALFEAAGIEAMIGSLVANEREVLSFISASGAVIKQYPLRKNGNKLALANGFTPDVIIMNNDMTAGIPDIIKDIEQPVIPPLYMGWFQRKKSTHFSEYKKLVDEFASLFSIDPWRLCARSHQCGMVDFKDKESLGCLAKSVDEIIEFSRKKHIEYGISEEPYVYIKADSGTYGMGIMTVKSGDEVLELNKKERNKMQVIKEGARVSEVIIQEGIVTIDSVGGFPAEPMIYMIDGTPVGGIYRINEQRDAFGNLNAAGMRFKGMCDESEEEKGTWKKMPDCNFKAHSIIASIAALAAGKERY